MDKTIRSWTRKLFFGSMSSHYRFGFNAHIYIYTFIRDQVPGNLPRLVSRPVRQVDGQARRPAGGGRSGDDFQILLLLLLSGSYCSYYSYNDFRNKIKLQFRSVMISRIPTFFCSFFWYFVSIQDYFNDSLNLSASEHLSLGARNFLLEKDIVSTFTTLPLLDSLCLLQLLFQSNHFVVLSHSEELYEIEKKGKKIRGEFNGRLQFDPPDWGWPLCTNFVRGSTFCMGFAEGNDS